MRNALIVLSCTFVPALAMAQNSAPIADAGPDQTVYLGSSILVNGSAMDPDGDPIVGWMWQIETSPAGSTPVLSGEFSADVNFIADFAGDYVLSLVAYDGTDWSLPDTVVISYVENQPPTAIAAGTPVSGPAPLNVHLDGTGSFDPEGGELVYLWEFGDGTAPALDAAPVHTYQNPGVYVAELAVEDDEGQRDYDSIEIVVTAPNNPPEAAPTATPNNGLAPLVVQFAANAMDPDGDALTYMWDFGDPASDDNASTLADPQHVYEAPGTYFAWLTVSDGQEDVSASVTVVVSAGQTLSTRRASVVKWSLNKSSKGTVSYWGDIDLPLPGADDVISFRFDGVKLFTKPFSEFRPGFQDGVYLVVKRRLMVRINFNTNRIYVVKRKVNLKKFDNSDGVDVELMWGESTAVDQFVMGQLNDFVWSYVRD